VPLPHQNGPGDQAAGNVLLAGVAGCEAEPTGLAERSSPPAHQTSAVPGSRCRLLQSLVSPQCRRSAHEPARRRPGSVSATKVSSRLTPSRRHKVNAAIPLYHDKMLSAGWCRSAPRLRQCPREGLFRAIRRRALSEPFDYTVAWRGDRAPRPTASPDPGPSHGRPPCRAALPDARRVPKAIA
jgi:hypothetical protein